MKKLLGRWILKCNCGKEREVSRAHFLRVQKGKNNNVRSLEDAFACTDLWHLSNGRVLCEPCHRETDTYLSKAFTHLKVA